ncbi:MAG: chemotaxis protein CheW [Acidobacteriota bacterium]
MGPSARYVSCRADGLLIGVNVGLVQQVTAGSDMTPVPLASPLVAGLLNLRGEIVTAVDLRRCLQLAERPAGQRPVHVVLRIADDRVSLMVDEIGELLTVDADAVEEPPPGFRGARRDLIAGAFRLGGGVLLALDIDAVLAASGTANVNVNLEGMRC